MTIGQSGDAPGTVVIGDPIDDAFDRNETHRSHRRLAARDPDAGGRARLRAVVARQGPDGWHGARGPARPCGRGIRASLGVAADHWPVRNDRALARLRTSRAIARLGHGPRLVARPAHRRCRDPVEPRDPGRAIAVAGLLSVLVEVIGVLAGLARFGFLAELLSAPVRYGYLNGIAVTILVSQLPKALASPSMPGPCSERFVTS